MFGVLCKTQKVRRITRPCFHVLYLYESQDQESFCPSPPRKVSVLPELPLGDLSYSLMGVPPQPNSPPDAVPGVGCCRDVTFVAFISNPISRSWSVLLPPKSCTVTIPKCISQINGNRFNCFPGMHKVITT